MNSTSNAQMPEVKYSNELPETQSQLAAAILLTSLEQNIGNKLKINLTLSLSRLQLTQLYEPTILLLNEFIVNAIKSMHYIVYKKIVDSEFCIDTTEDHAAFDDLYKNELAEHGELNIAKYCKDNELQVILTFPSEDDVVVVMSYPAICEHAICLENKLAKALGYRFLRKEANDQFSQCVVSLVKQADIQSVTPAPILLEPQNESKKLKAIFSQLGYGVVCFSSTGKIIEVSPSILINLNLESTAYSIQVLAKSIPTHFYTDVIWRLSLEAPSGQFENYRIRINTLKENESSLLYNVSGYRDKDSTIHTLWQAVSFDEKGSNNLSEGSILNEARIHNITRNYVPQLVEEKAREIVRLGGDELINEECFMAVLFCDIVGFTAYVENNENEESVIHTLNAILRKLSKSVKDCNGLIDKFMGDCIMVLFRDPHDAVVAALEMQDHSIDINNLRARAGQELLQLRIGIHWGKVIIGNVGTPERLDWTTIGDVVNTASRIEKHCQPGAVLISETISDEIAKRGYTDIKYGEVFHLQVKGKQKQLSVCYTYPE